MVDESGTSKFKSPLFSLSRMFLFFLLIALPHPLFISTATPVSPSSLANTPPAPPEQPQAQPQQPPQLTSATRIPPPTTALAIPLSVVAAILLVSSLLLVIHQRGKLGIQRKAAVTENTEENGSVGVEKAISMLNGKSGKEQMFMENIRRQPTPRQTTRAPYPSSHNSERLTTHSPIYSSSSRSSRRSSRSSNLRRGPKYEVDDDRRSFNSLPSRSGYPFPVLKYDQHDEIDHNGKNPSRDSSRRTRTRSLLPSQPRDTDSDTLANSAISEYYFSSKALDLERPRGAHVRKETMSSAYSLQSRFNDDEFDEVVWDGKEGVGEEDQQGSEGGRNIYDLVRDAVRST